MARQIIYKGEDKVIDISLTDDGTSVTLTSLSGIVVILYTKKTKKILEKYSLNSLTGYEPLTIVSNKIRIFLDRAITIGAEDGDVDAEILEEVANASFENNQLRSIAIAEIGTIERTIQGSIASL